MNTKYCRHCGKDKPLNDFETRRDSKDGKRVKCKECVKNKIHVYITTEEERIKKRGKNKNEVVDVQYFQHDPYYQF